jgi:hypothetical protein
MARRRILSRFRSMAGAYRSRDCFAHRSDLLLEQGKVYSLPAEEWNAQLRLELAHQQLFRAPPRAVVDHDRPPHLPSLRIDGPLKEVVAGPPILGGWNLGFSV